jgi:hypothetical protein
MQVVVFVSSNGVHSAPAYYHDMSALRLPRRSTYVLLKDRSQTPSDPRSVADVMTLHALCMLSALLPWFQMDIALSIVVHAGT